MYVCMQYTAPTPKIARICKSQDQQVDLYLSKISYERANNS